MLGGTVDTISNVGPLDGMWLGAKAGALGGHPVEGAIAGLAVGTFNLAGSIFFPEEKKALYDGVKNFAYGAVDVVESGVESTRAWRLSKVWVRMFLISLMVV